MRKKIIGLTTLGFFIVFSNSCAIYSWKETPLQEVEPEKRAQVKICAVQIRSGEKAEFKKNPGARFQGESIFGERIMKEFVLEKSKIKSSTRFKALFSVQITATDGTIYKVDRILSQNDSSVTFNGYVTASIPLADVDLLWIRQVNKMATILLNIAVPLGIFYGIAALFVATEGVLPGGLNIHWYF